MIDFADLDRRVAAAGADMAKLRAVVEWLMRNGVGMRVAHEVVGVESAKIRRVPLPDVGEPPASSRRLTGQEIFDGKTREEQDEMLGPEIAEAVRSGKVKLEDLVVEHRMETEDDFIAQATPQDLGIPPRDT